MSRKDNVPEDVLRSVGLDAEVNGHVPPYIAERLKTRLSDIVAEKVEFLWEKRIPKGKITIIDGDPGLGKSVLGVDLAARITTGRGFPDKTACESGGVVMLNAEDGFNDTVRPRVDAAEGKPKMILPLSTVPDKNGRERAIYIPEDIPLIRHAIQEVEAVLVVIDPLMAFLSPNVNAHKDQEVRQALAPLATMAAEEGCAVVLVRHLNKASGGNPLYRGGGSIGIVGAARSGLLVAEDPEDENYRILAVTKQNLTEKASSLRYKVVSAASNGAARIEWMGESPFGARDLVAEPESPEERTALDDAKDFLREELGAGPVEAKQVLKDARDNGIAERTLRRAKTALGIDSVREGDGPWSWVLPEPKPDPDPEDDPPDGGGGGEGCQHHKAGNLGNVGNLAKNEDVGNLEDPENSLYLSEACQGCQGCQHCQGNAPEQGDRGCQVDRADMVGQVLWLLTETPPEFFAGPKKALAQLRAGETKREHAVNAVLIALEVALDDEEWRDVVGEVIDQLVPDAVA